MGSRSTRAIASSSPRIAIICTTWIAGIGRSSSRRSARRIVRVCTVFSRTKRNATCSGTVGTERHPSISAVLGSLTTVRRESVCGPIKYLNAKTRVRIAFRIVKCNFNFTYSKVTGWKRDVVSLFFFSKNSKKFFKNLNKKKASSLYFVSCKNVKTNFLRLILFCSFFLIKYRRNSSRFG